MNMNTVCCTLQVRQHCQDHIYGEASLTTTERVGKVQLTCEVQNIHKDPSEGQGDVYDASFRELGSWSDALPEASHGTPVPSVLHHADSDVNKLEFKHTSTEFIKRFF
jgi:hypothetical protein